MAVTVTPWYLGHAPAALRGSAALPMLAASQVKDRHLIPVIPAPLSCVAARVPAANHQDPQVVGGIGK